MKIKFWGVRGSIPTPLNSLQLKSRISSIINRIQPEDLKTPETRETFLARLPSYLFGTVGGNTTCIEIDAGEKFCIIVDAGTGIRELGYYLAEEKKELKHFHIFLTHFHWDHIQGIPFFTPAFKKENRIYFYNPSSQLEDLLTAQMQPPYFPIAMDQIPAQVNFVILLEHTLKLGDMNISWKKMKHPSSSYAYKFSKGGKNIVIATDSEITEKEFVKSPENIQFFSNIDLLVLDSQYTLRESISKMDWGHSSYSMGVDLASDWKVKTLVLFHHEPLYNDRKILSIERTAKWYLERLEYKAVKVVIAMEGMELEV